MPSRSSLSSLASLIALLTLTGPARADLPPPDGTKFVGFAFKVDNLAPFKDFALLAYPCGDSNGAPSADMAELHEGVTIEVGRRGGSCALYAMSRADFDPWRKANPGNSGPAVSALFESKQVRACTGAPHIVSVLPTSDARSVVTETLHVTKLDATGCTVTSASAAASSPPAPPPAVNGGGCAGCTVGARPAGLGVLAATLSFAAIVLSRRAAARKRA